MDWLRIELPSSTSDLPIPIGITGPFQARYNQLNQPDGFAVYLSIEDTGRNLFVSPAARECNSELLRQLNDNYQIAPSDAPARFAVQLVAGEDILKISAS